MTRRQSSQTTTKLVFLLFLARPICPRPNIISYVCETLAFRKALGSAASLSCLTVKDHLLLLVWLVETVDLGEVASVHVEGFLEVGQGNVDTGRNGAKDDFVRFTNVNKKDIIARSLRDLLHLLISDILVRLPSTITR